MKYDALIGFSGFVGSTLLRQRKFENLYRSSNISEIDGKKFDLVICSAAPAAKWLANQDPDSDKRNIDYLVSHIETITCNKFVLISTVDVFKNPVGIDEHSIVDEKDLQAYGLHRRNLEKNVQNKFANHLIIRLPGLVGPGLRKNVLYDFLNNNNLEAIDSRAIYQFYPMVNLWFDIQSALNKNLKIIHFAPEPISVAEVSELAFGKKFQNEILDMPAVYDMRTAESKILGKTGNYHYSKRETVQAIRAYAQSEKSTKFSR